MLITCYNGVDYRTECINRKMDPKPNTVRKSFANVATRVIRMERHQSRYGRQISAIWELFSDYSAISTMHGVRYLGEKKRHWSERVFWLIIFVSSIFACTAFIFQAWSKWQNSPVIVTFSEVSTPVYHIPFPTVTICTDIRIKQSVLNYTHYWHEMNRVNRTLELTKSELEMLYSLSVLCDEQHVNLERFVRKASAQRAINANYNIMNARFIRDVEKVAPSLDEVFLRCNWHGKDVNCSSIFNEILTDEGLCYTFNYLNASEIYIENRLDRNFHMTRHNKTSKYWNATNVEPVSEDDVYPYRVLSGSEGLKVDLRLIETDIDYVCSGPVQSFKILLHSASEVPQMKKYYYRIPLDHDIVMAVRPNIMNTTESLISNYEKEQRKCVDENERGLLFFAKYTQRNCQLENLALRTSKDCNCTLFSMPRLPDVNICRTISDIECTRKVEQSHHQQVLSKKAISYDCLPACRSISYDAELSIAALDHTNYRRAYYTPEPNTELKHKYTRIFISFKDEQFFASRRAEMYGKTDFIANCGGILGLFMGVSILSIVEIIYFSTLRIGCSLFKKRKQKKRRLQRLRELEEEEIRAESNFNVQSTPISILSSGIHERRNGINSKISFVQN